MPSSSAAPLLPLSNDLVFKVLFSRQRHLLSDLINAVRHGLPPVSVVDVLNPDLLPDDVTGKQVVLDVLARDAHGTLFIVEMQVRRYLHWPERNLYYLARSLSQQLKKGEAYLHLKPAIGISLLMHDLFPEHAGQACWHFTLRDTQQLDVQLGQALQVHIIELRKAERLGGLPPDLSAWITCLRHSAKENVMSHITHKPVQEALAHLRGLSTEEGLRWAAMRREMAAADEEDALAFERQEARREGLEEGRQEGRKEGRQEGLEQGRLTLLRKLLARKFGPLPESIQQKLSAASSTQLDAWAMNVLDAATLDDVFADE